MALNNSSASTGGAAGSARRPIARPQKRAALNPSAAFQLFLEQRRRALRNSSSPEADLKFFGGDKSASNSLTQFAHNYRHLAAGRRGTPGNLNQLPNSHRYISRQAASTKLAKLYKRHRNLERAVSLFLLRRHLWRKSRRPIFNMDFIANLRRIQADEPSSDEESGLILTSLTAPVSRVPSPTSGTKESAAAPAQLEDAGVTNGKRKRDSAEDPLAPEEPAGESPRAAKKAKSPVPAAADKPQEGKTQTPPTADANPVPPANKPKSPTKRPGDDEKKKEGQDKRPVAKQVKPGDSSRAKPVPAKAAPAKAESSKARPTAPDAHKPLDKMEYFERRVHDMLTDPLGFDDFVYESNKPMPRHLAQSFARHRRRQTQSPPPLVMSGALGPAADAKPAGPKPKGPGSLAKEARKRAHQQKVNGKVESLKGKGVASAREDEAGKRSLGGKPAGVSKPTAGKRKERAWLTNAQGKSDVQYGARGGQKTPVRVKYTKSS